MVLKPRRVGSSASGLELLGLGDVHTLIISAGVSRHPTVARTDPRRVAGGCRANLNGPFACAHAALPQMVVRRGGSIVTVGSVNGLAALGE
ncbi:SDR family NAD(P)-dependent oxidoreductase [Rhizobium leguminosarum bv. viciae]|uniref:SDR family NAD(P)-dependent oxidoreductase n=1 Tax=Rhizobium ruizarguesonis TaxID=2081791 RepID=UPI0016A06E28|nr:SDR family NAD(P)-dependent oxidoreductase [Rhizobium leguminosarum bv. viciae]NKQ70954.1 hypothetical protein [Rhizobium ruizarguesonis]NKQ78679.1 hypothetical protein [Rhizobium ruizarguesonis]